MRYPFLSDSFFQALARSGATGEDAGWLPRHVQLDGGFLPLFERRDSRGEYVFDYAWADAYERYGYRYYPKLVSAIPYTPVVGPRWRGDIDAGRMWRAVRERMAETGASGWHLLFPDRASRMALAELPLVERQACHFRWFNHGYADFGDFLARFQSRKRKNLRREREKVTAQEVQVERRLGSTLSEAEWAHFYQCYASTYLKRGQWPYLTESFFTDLAASQGDQIMVALARHRDDTVAAALYLFDDQALYGRYWGCLREFDALHFELCYYQGIEFAIEQGLAEFDPGVQGEHKLLRGFEPVITYSLHWLAEPEFQRAVADFCAREARHVSGYRDEALTLLPFRSDLS